MLAVTNPVDLDGDADGIWTSPMAYAESTIKQVGIKPRALLRARAFDEAVVIQAADLCRASGLDVRDEEFIRGLAAATEPVRRGFAAILDHNPR